MLKDTGNTGPEIRAAWHSTSAQGVLARISIRVTFFVNLHGRPASGGLDPPVRSPLTFGYALRMRAPVTVAARIGACRAGAGGLWCGPDRPDR